MVGSAPSGNGVKVSYLQFGNGAKVVVVAMGTYARVCMMDYCGKCHWILTH